MISRILFFTFLILASCSSEEKQPAVKNYFDLNGYFTAEANRLKTNGTIVSKTVSRNGVAEIKRNFSPDWKTDLSLFRESDINRPAWSDSYKILNQDSVIAYTARDGDLRTRSVTIKKGNGGKISYVSVLNATKNYLYSSTEKLIYIPDSLYRIEKAQDVILLGKNNYIITGIVE